MTEVTISPELAHTAECVLRQFGWVAEELCEYILYLEEKKGNESP